MRHSKYKGFLSMFIPVVSGLILIGLSVRAQYQPRPVGGTQAAASITVKAPVGGETWERGQKYTIKWESTGVRGSVKIVLKNPGGRIVTVAASLLNSGSYTWRVGAGVAEGNYKVIVMTVDGQTRGESKQMITIKKKSFSPAAYTDTVNPAPVTNFSASPSGTSVAAPAVTTSPQTTTQLDPGSLPQAEIDPGSMNQSGPGQNMTGFISPDLAIADLRYAEQPGRLEVTVQNNGAPYEGRIRFRVKATEPSDGWVPYESEQTIEVIVSIGSGEIQTYPLFGFNWPSPLIDHHWLIFDLEVDPSDQIAESDEANNLFQTSICRPCGVEITGLSQSSFTQGANIGPFALYGSFGARRGTKTVQYEWHGDTHNFPISSWNDVSLLAEQDISGYRPGTYKFRVFCRHPAIDSRYHSNVMELQISEPDRSPGHEQPSDVRNIADALSEDFTQGLDFSAQATSLSAHPGTGGIEVRCHIDDSRQSFRTIKLVTHEVWHGNNRVRYWQDPGYEFNEAGHYFAHTFEALSPGDYEYRCSAYKGGNLTNNLAITFTVN